MFKRVIVALMAIAFVVSCSSKKKEGEIDPNAAAGVDGTDITAKPIEFDPRGAEGGGIPGLNVVNFPYDSSTLTSEAKQILAANAEWMKTNANTSIQVEGHCDAKGSNEYNLSLGERRANTVKSYLQGLGVEGSRLVTVSYGEEKLLDPSDTEAAGAKNRRANFVPSR